MCAMRKMKILHISSYDIAGGAARSAFRLHTELKSVGFDSSMLVMRKSGVDDETYALQTSKALINRLLRRLRKIRIHRDVVKKVALTSFTDDRTYYHRDLRHQIPEADIINLHWIAGFVDYQSFFSRMPIHARVVWTLHDMNPFTGGCHYDGGCNKYEYKCNRCPQLGTKIAVDYAYEIWSRKQRVLEQIGHDKLQIVAPSQWLTAKAKHSKLFSKYPIETIPYGIDLGVFAPRNKAFARDVLDIPPNVQVLLFVAHSLSDPRKGIKFLQESLKNLPNAERYFLLSVGSDQPEIDIQLAHLHLTSINNDRFLSLVYSAADVFIIPSQEDNLPNTVLEAMACGTPVIGFDVGGIPEMVRPNITGFLTPSGDVAGLQSAITTILERPEARKQMALNCRQICVNEYSSELQAKRYIDLYESLLEKC